MGNLQEEGDLENTVKISARRFEESPFISKIDDSNMVRGVYAGRYHAIYNGENEIEQYWTLRKKALIFDVPEKPIEISGPDAYNLLEKVICRKVSKLDEGRGIYAIACTPKGGIFMDGVLFKLGPEKYWYVQADGEFETWLLAHSNGCNVTITDPKSRVLQIQGPASLKIMNAVTNGKINEDMKYYRSGFFNIGKQKVYISRTGFVGELGYEIYTLGDNTDYGALWDIIFEKGVPFGLEFSSCRSLTIRRIEAGILGNLSDIDHTMTPYEAGLERIVELDKGDFIGKKSLENADKRPLLFGFTCLNSIPSAGSIIMENNQHVGRITAGVNSPTLNCGIGYVRFNNPGKWIGKKLTIKFSDGSKDEGEVVKLPFFDREKKLVRGI